METPKEMTDVMQEVRGFLDSLSRQIEEVMTELARIKESQNQILAGFAFHKRAQRLEESLGLEQKDSPLEEEPWDGIQAYCYNCLRMVPIIDPTATYQYARTIVEANCKHCRTKVSRILS